MTIAVVFFVYMVLFAAGAGGLLVAAPQAADFFLKPYFWILIAVALFDAGVFVFRGGPEIALTINARVAGFVVAGFLMFAIVTLAGSPAKLF